MCSLRRVVINRKEVVSLLSEMSKFCVEIADSHIVSVDQLDRCQRDGYQLKIKCALGDDSRKQISQLLQRRQVSFKEENGYLVFFSQIEKSLLS